jgi:hypothetical protein
MGLLLLHLPISGSIEELVRRRGRRFVFRCAVSSLWVAFAASGDDDVA